MRALLEIANAVFLILSSVAFVSRSALGNEQAELKTIPRPIGEARSIRVRIAVITDATTEAAEYSFVRKGDEWVGAGRCSVSGLGGSFQRSQPFNLSVAAVNGFLRTLEGINAWAVDDYRAILDAPMFHVFDYYPEADVVIQTETQSLRFFSRSSWRRFIPWGVVIANRTLVVRGDAPMRVIESLTSYLGLNDLRDPCKRKD